MSLKEIKTALSDDISAFDTMFKAAVKSPVLLLNTINNYIIRTKGKQMRPLFVLLAAKLNGGITHSSHVAASLIEILHTATLVHDDVVDDASKRRGFFSINKIWKNKIAVLMGDYLLSKGLLLATKEKEYQLLDIISDATKEMSEGELLQIQKSRSLNINEEEYIKIIKKKTASLIAACCAAGAHSANADENQIKLMYKLGEHVGVAFQIKDDLLDIESKSRTGKAKNVDLKEKKITLPLIYLLQNSEKKQRKHIIKEIKKHHNDVARMNKLADTILQSDGVTYAWDLMEEHKQAAFQLLDSFEDGEAKNLMQKLIEYTISRNK